MCQFTAVPVVAVHEDVSEDQPIIGYKVFLASSDELFSPYMHCHWKDGRMSNKRKQGKSENSWTGIYAFKTRKEAVAYRDWLWGSPGLRSQFKVLKVALYGRVVEHKGDSVMSIEGETHGFRAQHAKVIQ